MGKLRIWGLFLLVVSVVFLVTGRRFHALASGLIGALLATVDFFGARAGGEKRSLLDRIGLVGAGWLLVAVIVGSLASFGAYRERHQARKPTEPEAQGSKPSGVAPVVERGCRIKPGVTGSVALASDGGLINVERGTRCVVLNTDPSRMLIRVTDGPHTGAVGWLASVDIGIVSE